MSSSRLVIIDDYYFCFILLSKLPSYLFYPSFYTSISNFLSGRSIFIVDVQCSVPKLINRGVPEDSVLSPTLFPLIINDIFITNCSLHYHADDSTLHTSHPLEGH